MFDEQAASTPENEVKWRVPWSMQRAKPQSAAITSQGRQHLESDAGMGANYHILSEINDHGGSMPISDLANSLRMPYPRCKNMLINMQARGLVQLRSV